LARAFYTKKTMKSLISLLILNFLLSGCTAYQSGGRKQFESDASQKLTASSLQSSSQSPSASPFQLQSCRQESRIETWFKEEFPTQNYELVLSEDDLEIWKTTKNKIVEIKALQRNETGDLVCTYAFASEAVWNQNQESFVSELRNNLMTE